jgi:hypothetical protein
MKETLNFMALPVLINAALLLLLSPLFSTGKYGEKETPDHGEKHFRPLAHICCLHSNQT